MPAKIKKARTFNQGYMLTELLAAAELDLKWHTLPASAPLQDPDGGQGAQPRRQRVARRPGAPDHLIERAVAEEDLAHGEQCPLLANDVQRARHRAGTRLGGYSGHGTQSTS